VIGWADQIVGATFPRWSTLHQLMNTPSFLEKVSSTRQESIGKMSKRCFTVAYEIIRQGRACGELPEEAPSEAQILSGLVSLAKGAHLLEESQTFPEESGIHPLLMLKENYHIFLDGVGWKPFSHIHDYDATETRIKDEVFADELKSCSIS
ncbi:MAG: hypothetical protein AAF514_04535, partial [Verrucomicrobiota bacterium]